MTASSGSVFGKIGKETLQPSQEQFENNLYEVLRRFNDTEQVFVEQELSYIGRCRIPDDLFKQFGPAPKIFLRIPLEERIRLLVKNYAAKDDETLKNRIMELAPRMGQHEVGQLVALIDETEYSKAAARLLAYYDNAAGYDEMITGQDTLIEGETIESLFKGVISLQKKNAPIIVMKR